MKNFLDQFQREKVMFWGFDYKDYFAEHIGRENLEEKFGGYLPNLT